MRIHEIAELSTERPLTESEITESIQYLYDKDDAITSIAATVLVEQGTEVQVSLLTHISSLRIETKKILTAYLMSAQHVEIFSFFMQLLEKEKDENYVAFLIVALSCADYFILPLILVRIPEAEVLYRSRLQHLLKKIGFSKLKPYLEAFPKHTLPSEYFFREIFGDDAINSLS
jgi:hypothetical protein